MSHSLLTLFAPPDGYVGDFGMFCGFTASRDVLERIARAFSGVASRPRLAAFIHPTGAAVTDLPGIAWMHFKQPAPFRLLHAKVALLGFGASSGYCLRLAVSTGNWTAEPLTTSIDMFWSADLVAREKNPQLVADIRAADDLFGWLREKCDDALLKQAFDGMRPDARFREAVDRLPESPRPPRFIDTREKTMREQVLEKLGGRKKHLVIGSGYYEAGDDSDGLIANLRKELVRKKILTKDGELDLVLNPDNCQGLHAQAESLVKNGWRLRGPGSCHAEHRQAKLHAKFLYVGKHSGAGQIGDAKIYIGSANFSRMGFESTVRNGNLEAGIVITPDPTLSWRRNARAGIRNFLPGNFDVETEPTALSAGPAFAPPPAPPAPPPISFVEWEHDRIRAPDDCKDTVEIFGPDERPVALPSDWPAPPPAFVTLHPSGWKVPVRADGALVVPKRGQPSLEDILAAIGSFPSYPIGASEDDNDRDGVDWEPSGDPIGKANDDSRTYPLRQMMRLITRLTEAQRELEPREWQRWCRELRQELPGLAKSEQPMIEPFRLARASPLRALIDPEFLPDGVDVTPLRAAIDRIEVAWGLDGARDLWSP